MHLLHVSDLMASASAFLSLAYMSFVMVNLDESQSENIKLSQKIKSSQVQKSKLISERGRERPSTHCASPSSLSSSIFHIQAGIFALPSLISSSSSRTFLSRLNTYQAARWSGGSPAYAGSRAAAQLAAS